MNSLHRAAGSRNARNGHEDPPLFHYRPETAHPSDLTPGGRIIYRPPSTCNSITALAGIGGEAF